jgi:hypothetical protein
MQGPSNTTSKLHIICEHQDSKGYVDKKMKRFELKIIVHLTDCKSGEIR